jgi:hypothetical protein
MEPLEYPGKPRRDSEAEGAAARAEAQSIGQAMRAISGPLLRQVRRFQTLRLCRDLMSPQLLAHAAPFDVKYIPGGADTPVRGGEAVKSDCPPICVVVWYTASPTAQAALESRKRDMLAQLNERSPQLVEDFRYELASSDRIAQQLNILSAGPD